MPAIGDECPHFGMGEKRKRRLYDHTSCAGLEPLLVSLFLACGGKYLGQTTFNSLTPRNPIPDNARMSENIIIERLEFRGRCGVTPEERARPQPLAIDLELTCPLQPAGYSDDLRQTIDYAKIAQRTVDVGTQKESSLLETLAERILAMLFEEFPVDRVRLWLRKLHPPMNLVTGSVGISLDRTRTSPQRQETGPLPAQFLVQQVHRLPKGTALDVAAGSGRNTLFLATQGYQVDAIDRDADALARLSTAAENALLHNVHSRTIDLEQAAPYVPDLGKETTDVIVVFFYLYRPLFPSLMDALKPGGVLVYETFTIENHFRHKHPRRLEFCLAPNELLRLTSPLQVLHYDEGEHEDLQGSGTVYTAQLLAQKPVRPGAPA
jgi:FolB domain-containing protein